MCALLLFSRAQATLIGMPVDLSGTPIPGQDGDPTEFYIPLSLDRSGIFGVGGVGLSSDTCTTYASSLPTCGGGHLGLVLAFDSTVVADEYEADLWFDDLDLYGPGPLGDINNNPGYFVETLQLFSSSSLPTFSALSGLIAYANDPAVVSADGDSQHLTATVTASTPGTFYVGFLFRSYIINTYGKFTNTKESLVAKASAKPVTVPEPETLSLLGIGLLGLGLMTRRRRRAK